MTRMVLLAATACGLALPSSAGSAVAAADGGVSFAREVQPILAQRCFACHGPDVSEGGLRLDDPRAAVGELDTGGWAIVPGRPEESQLLRRVSAADDHERMPPEGEPLSDEQIETLQRWIAAGAEWEAHWAFVAPQRPGVPRVGRTARHHHDDDSPQHRSAWVRNPIDAFIWEKLAAAELTPAPPADPRTLARRAYFGLTGLPPTLEQLQAFLDDGSPHAWEDLVDELLASPHYGEHWARHWLDLVRYAETNSFERDGPKANAWKYRDYVIRSFNDDKPYDQFLREQLAGDELDVVTDETIIATGYYRLGIWDDEPADPVQARHDEWDDILSTTSQATLGLTVGCARCHDHKIDPISQEDYYSLLAFFADVTPYGVGRDGTTNNQWDLSSPEELALRNALRKRKRQIEREKVDLEEVGIRRMSATDQNRSETHEREALLAEKLQDYLETAEWSAYQQVLERLSGIEREISELPPAEMALALARREAHPEPTRIMQRGNPHAPDEAVEPRFPALFGDPPPQIAAAVEDAASAGRRRVLAEWIASPSNMLTARVIVNRVWQHHFGRGIVRSSSNFGQLGTPPTHPELLDWLAFWLVENDWQLKRLHRLIMTSSAYRMSSAGDERGLAMDPTNELFWRFDLRRLSAEEIRDSMLLVTGELNRRMHGPSFYPSLSDEVLATQSRPGAGWGRSTAEEAARRSIYIFVKRSLLPPLLSAFDFPDVDTSCEARFITTQPGQALALLNSEFASARAARLAERAAREAGDDLRGQVARAVELALQRAATADDVADGAALIGRFESEHGLSPEAALRHWCLTVLNLNEFVYLD